jgi:hypothetical protein
MRNTEKVRRSVTPNLLVQFLLAELTLQLAIDPSKSRRSIPARADGKKPTVDLNKSRRSIPVKTDGRSQQEPMIDPNNFASEGAAAHRSYCQISFLLLPFCSVLIGYVAIVVLASVPR